jgi:hypothetical protein
VSIPVVGCSAAPRPNRGSPFAPDRAGRRQRIELNMQSGCRFGVSRGGRTPTGARNRRPEAVSQDPDRVKLSPISRPSPTCPSPGSRRRRRAGAVQPFHQPDIDITTMTASPHISSPRAPSCCCGSGGWRSSAGSGRLCRRRRRGDARGRDQAVLAGADAVQACRPSCNGPAWPRSSSRPRVDGAPRDRAHRRCAAAPA